MNDPCASRAGAAVGATHPRRPGRALAARSFLAATLLTLLTTAPAWAADYARPEALVSTAWLADHLDTPGTRVVDMRRLGAEDYDRGHVPGAVNLPNDATRDPASPPSFVPPAEVFARTMEGLGISNDTRVIVYDDRGGLYAARLWWLLHYFGHANVALLDGHFVKWQLEGRPTTTTRPAPAKGRFVARPDPRWLATSDDVAAAIRSRSATIVDARTTAEIEGKDLRGIRRGGFIPTAVPLYWEDTFDPTSKALYPPARLAALLKRRGVEPSREVIAYCQVGMRASHDLFVLYLLGHDRLRLYLGSWEEWGNRHDLPIAAVPKALWPPSPGWGWRAGPGTGPPRAEKLTEPVEHRCRARGCCWEASAPSGSRRGR